MCIGLVGGTAILLVTGTGPGPGTVWTLKLKPKLKLKSINCTQVVPLEKQKMLQE
jgi:hypothetical protein